MRPTWNRYFLELAQKYAERSTCNRAKVGCILTRDNHIVSAGYNGSPSGADHCIDVGCRMVDGHCTRTVHAEVNAIIQAARNGVSTEGCTAYVTHQPCVHCSMALINAGVEHVHFILDSVRNFDGVREMNNANLGCHSYTTPGLA